MDEYAVYVWVAYGITAVLICGLLLHAVYKLIRVKKLLSRFEHTLKEAGADEG